MEEMKLLVANDIGNSEQDIIINNKVYANPNVYARVMKMPKVDDMAVSDILKDIHDNLIVSIGGQLYFIGQYALNSNQPCRSIEVGPNNNKVESEIVFVNTLAHIAGEALALQYEKNAKALAESKVIRVTVDMATAIPASQYTLSRADQFEKKFTDKTHTVQVFVGPEEYTVILTFGCVKCISEGVTASHAFIAQPEAFFDSYTADTLKSTRILHVAIGEGTTEFPITTGVAWNRNFVEGTSNGNGRAIDRVIDNFKQDFNLENITRQDFSRYVRDKSHKYHEDAVAYLMPALEEEAIAIRQKAEQVIRSANNEVDIVAVYGGGSILMKEYLKPRLEAYCKRIRTDLLYVEDEEQAVMLEAYGLNAFINSPLFDYIRESRAVA